MTTGEKRSDPHVRIATRDQGAPGGGGLACPECGHTIQISLNDLLIRQAFACHTPGCGIVLHLNQRGSATAIDTLRQMKARLREIGM